MPATRAFGSGFPPRVLTHAADAHAMLHQERTGVQCAACLDEHVPVIAALVRADEHADATLANGGARLDAGRMRARVVEHRERRHAQHAVACGEDAVEDDPALGPAHEHVGEVDRRVVDGVAQRARDVDRAGEDEVQHLPRRRASRR